MSGGMMARLEAFAAAPAPLPWEPPSLDELERLANEAAPGPWRECGRDNGAPDTCPCGQVWSIPADALVLVAMSSSNTAYTHGEGFTPEQARANARFSAAANPATLLYLIQRMKDLKRELDEANDYIAEQLELPSS